METLPQSHIEFCRMLYSYIDFEYLKECNYTLHECIKSEKNARKLTIGIVRDWLQGLPTACTIPFDNHEIQKILESCGNQHWSIDDYWRYSASKVLSFALAPNCYK